MREQPILGYFIYFRDLGWDCETPICVNMSHAWLVPGQCLVNRWCGCLAETLPDSTIVGKDCMYVCSGLLRIIMHKLLVIGLKDQHRPAFHVIALYIKKLNGTSNAIIKVRLENYRFLKAFMRQFDKRLSQVFSTWPGLLFTLLRQFGVINFNSCIYFQNWYHSGEISLTQASNSSLN